MKRLCKEFICVNPSSEEISTDPDPKIRAIENAKSKVYSVSDCFSESLIIGADTIVHLENRFLGKPENHDKANKMLCFLSGKTHQVLTGVVVLNTRTNVHISDVEVTNVRFKNLSWDEIDNYVASGEPFDKAGGYAIQGKGLSLIDEVNGSYSNVVGLPMKLLRKLLAHFMAV